MHIGIRRNMECWLIQKLINLLSEMTIESKNRQLEATGKMQIDHQKLMEAKDYINIDCLGIRTADMAD